MPIAHKNPDTGATEYSEGVGSGTTPGNPHRGKSILQDGNLVNAGNPLHVQSSDLAGRIGGTSDGAAANDTANASLISLTKRGLQHLAGVLAGTGTPADAAATSDTATASQVGLLKRALGHLTSLISGVGVDGATPPTIAGSGLRGWARGAYEQLVTVVARLPASGVSTESTQATVSANIGSALDSEATGNGSVIAVLKRLRTLVTGRGKLVQAKLIPSLSTITAYTAGDALGPVQFVDNLTLEAGEGLLTVSAKAIVVPAGFAFDLIIFDAAPTAVAIDNEPYNTVYATHPSVAAWYVFDGTSTYERVLDGTLTNTRAQKPNPTLSSEPNEVVIPSTGRGLWFQLIGRTSQASPFGGASDLVVTVSFSRA